MQFLTKIITTVFFVGYLPAIPGTFGSLPGLLFVYLLKDNPVYVCIAAGLVFILGVLFCSQAEHVFGRKDPGCVVIDEVCGMMITLLYIPISIPTYVFGFFLFRLLDTLKPYPAGRFERLPGGWGIMLDDCVAGLYANITLMLFLNLR